MTEPLSPLPAPLPVEKRTGVCWPRVRLYAWAIILVLTMWVCGTVVMIWKHPERFVDKLLAQLPFPSSHGKVFWVNRRTLEIDDVKLGGFFYADSLVVTASPFGLLRRHVAKFQIIGGQLFTKPLYATMDRMGSGGGDGLDWVIGRLEISRGTLMLDNVVADTSIPVRLGVRHPIVLTGLRLGKPDSSPEMMREREAEIGPVNIVSPFDPISPVLAFPLTRVRFTYSELWHHQIREVDLVRPTMFLGEDLFWFSEQFQKSDGPRPAQGPASPWQVGHFEIQYGQLAVNAFGQPVVRFPFFIQTQVDNIQLDKLDEISAKSAIVIQRLDQDYPDYKIRLVNLTGRLYFSLPITDSSANNVVNTISIEEVSWNDIPVKNVSTTVTFDPQGVYGKLSGVCEGGQLNGNFEFYYTKGFTWNANFFANKINVQSIAQKLGGKYINLTGNLNGKLGVQGKVTEILNCQGTLALPEPGVLEIKSLDNFLKDMPVKLTLKDQAVKLAVESFRTYPYETGELKINYTPAGGTGELNLVSPLGGRKFEVDWHPYESSKVAKGADKR